VHLHVHTEYSPLDGMTNIAEACAKVAADGQVALAATDHGNLSGAWQLNKHAHLNGIKPLIGAEVYLAVMADWKDEPDRTQKQSVEVARDDESAVDDDAEERGGAQVSATKNKKYEHLTIFATTAIGWKNLAAMMDRAEEDGFYMKPRIDYKLLKQYAEGLIVLTGCLGGPVLGPVSRGELDQARSNLNRIIEAVGKEKVFVEIMEHGIPAESNAMPVMWELAKEFGLPLVATNDSHYTHESEKEAHEAWLAVQSGKSLSDPKRFHFHGEGYHLRTEVEMRALRPEPWWQVACDNTVAIAAMFDDNILPEQKNRLPVFPLPDGFDTAREFGVHLAKEGWKKRFGDLPMPIEVKQRLNSEVKIIDKQGYIPYFLIVWDLVKWAREDGNFDGYEPKIEGGILVGPGRGSAAGSYFSYLLEIVDIDPLENNLLFERFMEAEREDMPDIDLDFEAQHLERVRAYLAFRWGADRVARIGTHNVAQTKAAIKDAARILDLPAIGAVLNRVVPDAAGGEKMTFKELEDLANGGTAKFREVLLGTGEDGLAVVDLAKKMAGTIKGEGVHACGIIIATEPLRGLIPLRRDRSKTGSGLSMITSWDAGDIGDVSAGGIGLLKLDVLSIRNLDMVSQAVEFIEETTGEVIDPRNLPHPNTRGNARVAATWALLKAGRSSGVFQMDSDGMQKVSRDVGPESLTDLSAIVALFRPGPLGAGMVQLYSERKSGVSEVDYNQFTSDPAEQAAIASVLGETYGVWVFQEQLMRLGAVVAGFDGELRNKLRKAVAKKKKDDMAYISEKFLAGAVKEFRDADGNITSMAFAESTAHRLIDAMQASAAYLFNASHSAAYAQLAYTTAYFKANWPAEYGAAILATTDDTEKRLSAIEALNGEGIEILPPDVNLSRGITSPVNRTQVRLGLGEIKGVGQTGADVVDVREVHGDTPFISLANLIERMSAGTKSPTITSIEGLIESGACDEFGPRLGQLMISRAVKSNIDIEVPDAEFSILERSIRQRAKLGVSLGEHPLVALAETVQAWVVPGAQNSSGQTVGEHASTIDRIPAVDGQTVLVSGLLSVFSESAYSKGRRANITLEGVGQRISGVMWDAALKSVIDTPLVGSVVAVRAVVSMRQREIFDEEGEIVEVLVTKELNISKIYEIPVDSSPAGLFLDATERAVAFYADGAAELPEVPALTLIALPKKPKAERVDVLPPTTRLVRADATAAAAAAEPGDDDDESYAELVFAEPAMPANDSDFIPASEPPHDWFADADLDVALAQPVEVSIPDVVAYVRPAESDDYDDREAHEIVDDSIVAALLAKPKAPGVETVPATSHGLPVRVRTKPARGVFAARINAGTPAA
jgi:DNA polymerase-3 subunit alpha